MQASGSGNAVLIMAAGRGVRLGGDIPKQFRMLHGRPVLHHTIEAFHRFDPEMEVLLVLPPGDGKAWWNELLEQYPLSVSHGVVEGGPERFFSVRNALAAVPERCKVVGVHDGVRPLVSADVIRAAYESAAAKGSGIPCIALHDSIREVKGDDSTAVNRSAYRLVQTPQCFRTDWLKEAYDQPFHEGFTDDASVFEAAGRTIHLVPGDRVNIKITAPGDLELAEFYLARMHSR